MAPSPPPSGIYVPMVCFFTPDESIDYEANKSHILRLARSGITGLVIHGSNGEATHLLHSERQEMIKHVRSVLDDAGFKDVLIIAGCSANSIRESIMYAQEAKEAGAKYGLLLPPSYWAASMSADVILRFYKEVGDKSPIPLLIYNFPGVCAGIDLNSDAIANIAKACPNVVGVKLTCGNLGKISRLTATFPQERFAVFAGKAELLFPGLVCGSAGAIAALANVMPKSCVELLKLYKKGDMEGARKLQGTLALEDWNIQKAGVSGVKAAVAKGFGYGNGRSRGPLKEVKPDILPGAQTFKDLLSIEKAKL
jgi:4-hydroxy-2-oxoglutarate aldolase